MFTQRSRNAITVTWETFDFHHFTSEKNKVSKSNVVEKVIPAADFIISANDMCQASQKLVELS